LLGESSLKPGTQLFLPISLPLGFRIIEFTLDKECPDHSSIPKDRNTSLRRISLDDTPQIAAKELGLGDDWKLEFPFDFISKFTCHKCGNVESVRKPFKEIKQSQTKCPQCPEIYRDATKYFQITSKSEDAELSFRAFALCEREVLQYVHNNQRINIELVSGCTNT
jgi:hypothetical protein